VARISIFQKCIGWHIKADTVCVVLATLSHMQAFSGDVAVDVGLVENCRKSWGLSGFWLLPKRPCKGRKELIEVQLPKPIILKTMSHSGLPVTAYSIKDKRLMVH